MVVIEVLDIVEEKTQQEAENTNERENREPTLLERAASLKQKGNESFAKNDMESAAKYFSEAIDLDPENHLLYSNRCAALQQLGRLEEALLDANFVIAKEPKFAKGHFRKAKILMLLNRLDEAVQSAHDTVALGVDCTNLLKELKEKLKQRKAMEKRKKMDEIVPPSPEEIERLALRVQEEAEALRKQEEEEEEMNGMRADWERGERRKRELQGRKLETRARANGEGITAQAQQSIEAEEVRQKQDAAKFRALAQHMDYEGFRQLVAGAKLKPMAKTEGVWNMAEERIAPANRAFQAGGTDNPTPMGSETDFSSTPTSLSEFSVKVFQDKWRQLTGKSDHLRFDMVRDLTAETTQKLFQVEVDPNVLGGLLTSSNCGVRRGGEDGGKEDSLRVLSILSAAAGCPRFDLALMFLEKKEKVAGTSLFDFLSQFDHSQVAHVRQQYKL